MKTIYAQIVFFGIFLTTSILIGVFGSERDYFFDVKFALKELSGMPSFYLLFLLSISMIFALVGIAGVRKDNHRLASIFFFLSAAAITTPVTDFIEAGLNHPGVIFVSENVEMFFNLSIIFSFIFFIQGFVYYAYHKIIVEPNCCQIPESIKKELYKNGAFSDKK